MCLICAMTFLRYELWDQNRLDSQKPVNMHQDTIIPRSPPVPEYWDRAGKLAYNWGEHAPIGGK
ncbi:MAG: hypothetical protein BZY81_00600 [SAR202 cluster bacterium Io17-Chloro-G4]|nr:MAG: hypothetical protein BZY81_00600 [SAR202 cluster bacterium Io17-Chloro-G4]